MWDFDLSSKKFHEHKIKILGQKSTENIHFKIQEKARQNSS